MRMGYIFKWQILWLLIFKDVLVVYVGFGCKFLDGIDFIDIIVFVECWFCSFVQKEKNIFVVGGKYIFIFDFVELDCDGFYFGDWIEIVFVFLVEKDG